MFAYSRAIVRDLPQSFSSAVQKHKIEIDVALAEKQHKEYEETLRKILPTVIRIDADEKYPDCCFVEDTCVAVGKTVVINHMGHESRRGEEVAIQKELEKLEMAIVEMKPPATLDGGDVLLTEKEVLVGLSSRTNKKGIETLTEAFDLPVRGIPVPDSLHLKSLVSALDGTTLLVGDTKEGETIMNAIGSDYQLIKVPFDTANVLRVREYVIVPSDIPQPKEFIAACDKRQLKILPVNMSELRKADGALTCCSVLLL